MAFSTTILGDTPSAAHMLSSSLVSSGTSSALIVFLTLSLDSPAFSASCLNE